MLIRLMRYNLMFFVSICLLTALQRECRDDTVCTALYPPVSLPVSYRPAVISDDEARPDLVTMVRVAPEMVMIFQQR